MRLVLINTGTELLLGDVRDAHLAFIAREIFSLGLRIDEQRTVPDGAAIRDALADVFPTADVVFVTGGLGPTTDDITREVIADLLGLKLEHDSSVMAAITERLTRRGIRMTDRISRQAFVPKGATVLPNEFGTAPGFFLPATAHPVRSPALFVLPGPPRELNPMFRQSVIPLLRALVPAAGVEIGRKIYRITGLGESLVEEAIGEKVLAIPGIELGYCARPGEVDLRIVGNAAAIEQADTIITSKLQSWIFSTDDEDLAEVIVKLLSERRETLAVAESCTGGLLANRITNVPGASKVFHAGYIPYANRAKIDLLGVDKKLIEEQGAVSEPVAVAMAIGTRQHASTTYALATTGIAGPSGGSETKPVGTVYVALAAAEKKVRVKKFFFPGDRATFKELATQSAFEMLRRQLIAVQ
jgi:nicotinamide-nucleotide amidase